MIIVSINMGVAVRSEFYEEKYVLILKLLNY